MPASFQVCGWALGPAGDRLDLSYVVEHPTLGRHELVEQITLPVVVPDDVVRGREFVTAATLLAVAAGVSYFKVAAPDTVTFGPGLALDDPGRAAMAALYDEGLREFSHANGLTLPRPIVLPPAAGLGHDRTDPAPAADVVPAGAERRALLPIGAGRDSSLLAAVLAATPGAGGPPLLLAIGENPYAARVAAATGLPLVAARRALDRGLLDLNAQGAMNGHIPVTAINSLISVIVALATGCGSVVMANERSASQATRVVDGVAINHQYSKSFAFELLLRAALAPTGIDYFSALRPWGELPIARAFAEVPTEVHRSFMSCNRAFVRDPARRSAGWCGDCPKCRSVYLSLAPFMAPPDLASIFGRDLLDDAAQVPGFLALVDPDAKPFECVGEIDEARVATALLAADDRWAHHVVVRALAAGSPPPTSVDAFDRSDAHAVPPDVLRVVGVALDPSPQLISRVHGALTTASRR